MKVIGYYNELRYTVETTKGEVLYEAGNSQFDSTYTVPAEDGVGLDTMKKYCEQSAKEIALEHNAQYVGIEYREDDTGEC